MSSHFGDAMQIPGWLIATYQLVALVSSLGAVQAAIGYAAGRDRVLGNDEARGANAP